jgi:hypothetical protein
VRFNNEAYVGINFVWERVMHTYETWNDDDDMEEKNGG